MLVVRSTIVFHFEPHSPCRVTFRFSLRGLIVGEGQRTGALLHLPNMFIIVLRVRVKERVGRVKVWPGVDADRFVCTLVGEGH